MKTLTAIIMGCGSRGSTYAWQMTRLGEKYSVIGIAEPSQSRRDKIKKMHNIPEENCYNSWDEILDKPKMADITVISMLDHMHYEPALKAIELGYDILLEKTIAQTAKGEKPTDEEVLEALKTTDYGLCVFHANNDVVDH